MWYLKMLMEIMVEFHKMWPDACISSVSCGRRRFVATVTWWTSMPWRPMKSQDSFSAAAQFGSNSFSIRMDRLELEWSPTAGWKSCFTLFQGFLGSGRNCTDRNILCRMPGFRGPSTTKRLEWRTWPSILIMLNLPIFGWLSINVQRQVQSVQISFLSLADAS